MSGALPAEEDAPVYRPAPVPKKVRTEPAAPQSSTMLDALFAGKAAREQFKTMVLEVLRSPEGQAVIAQAVWKELAKHK